MKTKKEKLLKETYDKFIQISLNELPVEGMEEYIDPKVMGYGTTVDEKVLTIDDYRKLLTRQREQGKGIKMTFELTPVLHRIAKDGNSALFVDECVISIHLENNPIELFIRLSTILEYHNEKWVVVHWHGSKPEYEKGETDTWHINEWQQRQAELEKQVEEKTADLLIKNRELEIESALERVRTVAMSMSTSDDLLGICEVTFNELLHLGFDNIRNTVIHIPNDEQQYLMDYDYSKYTGGTTSKIEYGTHPVVDKYMEKIRSAEDAYFEVVISKDELNDWTEFRKNSGQSDDARLDEAEALYYYLFSIGNGDVGISTFNPISESQIKILKRFRNVFNLAYKRHTDITLAEAQAREAQIEVALERVRSKTMAKQKRKTVAISSP